MTKARSPCPGSRKRGHHPSDHGRKFNHPDKPTRTKSPSEFEALMDFVDAPKLSPTEELAAIEAFLGPSPVVADDVHAMSNDEIRAYLDQCLGV